MKNVLISLFLVVVFAFTLVSDKDYRLPYQEQDYIKIERDFGYSNTFYPVQGIRRKFNKGVVFQLEQDAEIYSIQDGVVVKLCDTCEQSYYGNHVEIRHNDSITVRYYHLGKITTSLNKKVSQVEPIALSGNSGYTIGNGLGIIVRLNDSIINPLSLLPKLENRN